MNEINQNEWLNMLDMAACNLCNVGSDVQFERLRRITGYLTTTLDKWNDAKRQEEADRVIHNIDNMQHD